MLGWLGPVVGNVQHEGWIVPLFADGAEGAGTSSAHGILVGRRPRHGSAAGMPAPRAGEPGTAVLVDGEEWRPDAAVVGWAAACDCGWRGAPWTRVSSGLAADPAARLLHVDGPHADLDEDSDGQRQVIDEWRQHIAPFRNLEQLTAAAERSAAAATELDEAVRTARQSGASWADIGRATAMSRQSANERWSSRL